MASKSEQVSTVTAQKLYALEHRPDPAMRAALANLRKGIGLKPGALPQLWCEIFDELPEEMYSRGGEPSREEWAIYTAMTLYALHRQGKAESVNKPGISLGRAAAGLVKDETDRERIWKRFYVLSAAEDMQEMSYRLRGLIQLLRNEDVALDYPQLAADLYRYQFWENADSVRLKWGQDFYRKATDENGKDEEQ